jgi:hypothetical protein
MRLPRRAGTNRQNAKVPRRDLAARVSVCPINDGIREGLPPRADRPFVSNEPDIRPLYDGGRRLE